MNTYPYTEVEDGPQPKLQSRGQFVRELLQTGLMVLAIYTLINLAVPLYKVEGRSMEPNFHDSQRLIVSRIAYMLGEPARGDVIVLRNPTHPDKPDLIKRIIGLPGETVTIQDGQVFINGVPIDEPYIEALGRYTDEWTLGPDEFFVLGDNRNNSRDSNDFGPIDRSHIVGRAWISYWSPAWWGIVPPQSYSADENTP